MSKTIKIEIMLEVNDDYIDGYADNLLDEILDCVCTQPEKFDIIDTNIEVYGQS